MRVNPRGNKPQAKRVAEELLGHDEAVLSDLRASLDDLYSSCGPDLGWVNKTPTTAEFVDVLCDLAAQRCDEFSTAAGRKVWSELSAAARRALCLSVGP